MTCSIDGCTRPANVPGSARGWCRAHYRRWQRRGDPTSPTPPKPRRDPLERWWSKVQKAGPDDCWLWTGSRDDLGYGWFRHGNRMRKSHRAGWELLNGPIPAGGVICHRCDNPPCVNPAHLFLGSSQDNVDDRVAKGRSSRKCPHHGETSPSAKITAAQVAEIRRRYAAGGVSQSALGMEYGISQTHIGRIVRGVRWAT